MTNQYHTALLPVCGENLSGRFHCSRSRPLAHRFPSGWARFPMEDLRGETEADHGRIFSPVGAMRGCRFRTPKKPHHPAFSKEARENL